MSLIEFDTKDGIGTITVSDPERKNALTLAGRKKIGEIFLEVEANPKVRCVVLTGANECFIAGGDVKSFEEKLLKDKKKDLEVEFLLRVESLNSLIKTMQRIEVPIIAKVDGPAAGLGVSLALACDLVVASDRAVFYMAYNKIGLTPDGGLTYSLPRAVGVKKAMQMALLGEGLAAKEALACGLINYVIDPAKLHAWTDKLALKLAHGPTFALGKTKRLIYQSLERGHAEQLQAEAEAFSKAVATEDFHNGVLAFCQKRRPDFMGH